MTESVRQGDRGRNRKGREKERDWIQKEVSQTERQGKMRQGKNKGAIKQQEGRYTVDRYGVVITIGIE